VFQPKNSSRCHHRRSPRRTFQLRQIKKTTILLKGSFIPEPSNTTDQEQRAKLEALMKARAEKTTHIQEQPSEQQMHQNDDDDDTIDRELERVQQKIQQLQKEKEKFASQLQAKRKISEKLEQLNQAREQIETIQREIDEMKEQENSSLWQDSPH
jgi:DNA repair ATPase RecN